MLQDWEQGLVGNNPGTITRLAKRAPLSQAIVLAVRPFLPRRAEEHRRAA